MSPEHCHVLPAYPEVHHHDVVLHYGLPGGEACAAHHHHHGGTLHSVPGCGCHPHGHHHKHGCGCAKEF
ncbi:hypothetical protein VSS37_03710 [Candidatus Thiothrix sp. Deng01]|uniref:Uncharacterized protein n=1 Tax=Candidatus Thiothrix phosphatis TaxID=3112415 RepID=A0ABU6CVG8_9GAMM|nr:hypothetical protein [Candidatus Thiothrix sp. Deng01]MEB4590077.1 hypothetical protein [Candidatus Thiothrix sp. Deng01]